MREEAMRLQDKAALVTGAGQGIGRAIALAYGREGARVAVVDRNGTTAGQVARAIVAAGGQAEAVVADLAQAEDCVGVVEHTVKTFGRIDIVVNNAGVRLRKYFMDTSLAEWDAVMKVNLTAPFIVCQAAARHMRGQGGGRIVNVASVVGYRGSTGRAGYGTAKAGLMQLTRIIATELARDGIVCNAIAPGPVWTEGASRSRNQIVAFLERIPMHKYGTPEAIADAAVYLASDECRYVTGHVLNVDGGFEGASLMYDIDAEEGEPLVPPV